MELDLEKIEDQFQLYLKKSEKNIRPYYFQRTYIQLLLFFSDDLSLLELKGILERKKQLNNEDYNIESINELRIDSRNNLNLHLKNNDRLSKKALLNRLIFSSLIDTYDNYFTSSVEVLFLFLSVLEVPISKLELIFDQEFPGWKGGG